MEFETFVVISTRANKEKSTENEGLGLKMLLKNVVYEVLIKCCARLLNALTVLPPCSVRK